MEQTQVNETVVAAPVVEKTDREIHFENLMGTVTAFKSQITAMQNQIKLLEKTVNKEFKGLQKAANKSKGKGNRKPSGFAKSSKISDTLCVFMNKPQGTEMARTEVTKFIISYIKDKGLQQPDNKKFINRAQVLSWKMNDEYENSDISKLVGKDLTSTKVLVNESKKLFAEKFAKKCRGYV